MNNGYLLRAVARFFDKRRLKRVKNHAKRGRRGRSLRIILIRLAVYMLTQHDIRTERKRRLEVLGHRYDRYPLMLADIEYGQQLLCLSAA